MPAFLPTGSLTGLAFIGAIAWLIRFLRRSSQHDDMESDSVVDARFGTLSPNALLQLVSCSPYGLSANVCLCSSMLTPCRVSLWICAPLSTRSADQPQNPSNAHVVDSSMSQVVRPPSDRDVDVVDCVCSIRYPTHFCSPYLRRLPFAFSHSSVSQKRRSDRLRLR